MKGGFTTETRRTQRKHREKLRSYDWLSAIRYMQLDEVTEAGIGAAIEVQKLASPHFSVSLCVLRVSVVNAFCE